MVSSSSFKPWASCPGLRNKVEGQKRFDVKATHFGRKYFETACLRAGLEPWQIKIFRGDILPTDLGYQGLKEEELTKTYLKAMPELSLYEQTSVSSNAQKQNEFMMKVMLRFMEKTGNTGMFDEIAKELEKEGITPS